MSKTAGAFKIVNYKWVALLQRRSKIRAKKKTRQEKYLVKPSGQLAHEYKYIYTHCKTSHVITDFTAQPAIKFWQSVKIPQTYKQSAWNYHLGRHDQFRDSIF